MLTTSTIQVGVTSVEQLEALIAFCEQNGLRCDGVPLIRKSPIASDTTYRAPIPAFKGFCGPERLNAKGQISPAAALEYIESYMKRNNLIGPNGIMRLNDTLKELFNVAGDTIYWTQLPDLVESLFIAPLPSLP